MLYQLTWKTLPGLRGLSCSEFSAAPAASPDTEKGVAIECSSESERDAILRDLEEHFAGERFTNSASAFETVKAFALEHFARKT